jgi:phosphate-selective porin OprO/OprP
LAAQGGSMNGADGEGDADEGRAVSGRFTYAPILDTAAEHTQILHLGAHARRRYQNDAPQRIRVRPQNGRDTRWIDATSAGANRLEEDDSFGAEIAYVRGPFSVQAEYAALRGETAAGPSRTFSAHYVDAHWSITGEPRRYRVNQGAFGATTPRAPLGQGGWGHFALSARYDHADLADGADQNRGQQDAYALGLEWIPVEDVRFMLNVAHSVMDRSVGVDDEADIISLRGQWSF